MKSKRPWKKHARIDRVEYNSGDVKFRTFVFVGKVGSSDKFDQRGEFESYDEAEADLNTWWGAFWPQQVKRTSKA